MSIRKFKSFEDAEQALWEFHPDKEYYARLRTFFSMAERLSPIKPQPGIRKFRNIEEKDRCTLETQQNIPAKEDDL